MAGGPAARHDSCRAPLARENDASLGESEREREERAFARLESPAKRVVEWRARRRAAVARGRHNSNVYDYLGIYVFTIHTKNTYSRVCNRGDCEKTEFSKRRFLDIRGPRLEDLEDLEDETARDETARQLLARPLSMSGPGRPGARPVAETPKYKPHEMKQRLTNRLTQFQREVDYLRETCKKVEEERDELVVKLHSETENAEKLSITRNELKAEVDTLTREKNDALSQLETVRQEVQDLRNALASRNQEYNELDAKKQKIDSEGGPERRLSETLILFLSSLAVAFALLLLCLAFLLSVFCGQFARQV